MKKESKKLQFSTQIMHKKRSTDETRRGARE